MEKFPDTYDETVALIKQLEKHAEALKKSESAALLADMRAKIIKYGLTAEELGLSTDSSVLVKKPAVKKEKVVMYRYGNLTWSGSPRGVKPEWVKDKLSKGESLEPYRVMPEQAAP